MARQHPLDRDDEETSDDGGEFDFSSPQSGHSANPEKKLLKLSIRAIVFCGVLVVLSSVAVNNIRYGSIEFTIASVINRMLMLLLLSAFIGVLLAYQLPNIRRKLSQRKARLSMGDAHLTQHTAAKSLLPEIGLMGWLVAINVIFLIFAWVAAFLLSNESVPLVSFVLATVSGVLPGLLIAMIVWNKGFVRAYAIGALATYLLSTVGSIQQAMLFSQMGMGNNRWATFAPDSSFAFMTGIHWTTIALGGLLPAGYVWLLEKLRPHREESTDRDQFTWKPPQ